MKATPETSLQIHLMKILSLSLSQHVVSCCCISSISDNNMFYSETVRKSWFWMELHGSVCAQTCVCVCVPISQWSICWSSEWVVCFKRGALETLYQHAHSQTHAQKNTHIQNVKKKKGETGNHTNAAQQRVEQAEAFFQMCDINLVDPKTWTGSSHSLITAVGLQQKYLQACVVSVF